VLSLPPVLGPLPAAVVARLPEAGVAHPVTGVLLAFRAWDTLLEIAVLAAAWLAARSLAPETAAVAEPVAPLLAAMTRILLPLLVVVAGYLLWRGSHAPGGAFQAGALLAAGGVLGSLCRMCWPLGWRLPIALGLGVAVFLGVGLATLASGRAFLEYPPALAGHGLDRRHPGNPLRPGAPAMSAGILYALAGVLLFVLALLGLGARRHVVRKVLAVNLMGTGAFLVLVGLAQRIPGAAPDPVAHALVLTGIVVAVSATALALALARRAAREQGHPYLPEDA
jgi:multisubunit Na+/H+ antiporter MnhC subunit/multisubunit Na+/H+ antiporter MnhB subunit